MDDRNELNTKVIVLNAELIVEEGFTEKYCQASSAHLEMIKEIIRKLQSRGFGVENVKEDNIREAALGVVELINGLVVQVFPNEVAPNEVLAVIYFDDKGLKDGVLSNLERVYNNLISSKIMDKAVCLKGVLFSPKKSIMESYPVEASDTEDNLAFAEIVSNLPFKKSMERK